jgi:hypothetical protein
MSNTPKAMAARCSRLSASLAWRASSQRSLMRLIGLDRRRLWLKIKNPKASPQLALSRVLFDVGPRSNLQSQASMVRDAKRCLLWSIYVGEVSMHPELHAILIGLLVIALASVAIHFATKKRAPDPESRHAFISAHTEVLAQRQARG